MSRVASPSAFTHLRALQNPILVFDLKQASLWWSNAAGLKLFGASSVNELQGRFLESASQSLKASLNHLHNGATRRGRLQDFLALPLPDGTVSLEVGVNTIEIAEDRPGLLVEVLGNRSQGANPSVEAVITEYTQKLEAIEKRYIRAVETAAIWDWDVKTNKLYLSPSFAEKLGYTYDELKAFLQENEFWNLVYPEDFELCRQEFLKHFMTPSETISFELRILPKEGDPIWFSLQGRHYLDEAGHPFKSSGLMTDITARKALEKRLLATQRLEAVGQLTAGVAHDFNNILSVIMGNTELISTANSTDAELINDIRQAARRGATLTRHLLAFSSQQTLDPKPVSLAATLSTLEPRFETLFADRISVVVGTSLAGAWRVQTDPGQIETALHNLVLNARDAMPNGGQVEVDFANISREASFELTSLQLKPGEYVRISVSDTGTGMDPDTVARAFEPFFTTKEFGKGSGLGLSMVLGFSRQSGGSAEIFSTSGEGTTVSIYLPRAQDEVTQGEQASGPQSFRGHIHVLDDDLKVGQTIERLLHAVGYRVSRSTGFKAAVAYASSKEAPDLYLLELTSSEERNGYDFAEWLVATDPSTKIMFMTGSSEVPDRLALSEGRSFAVLRKPFSKKSLSKALDTELS